MKNLYYLVKSEQGGCSCVVVDTFTNKAKAITECRNAKRTQKAGNALRKAEGSRERDYSGYYVTTSDAFQTEANDKIDFSNVIYS